MLPPLGMGESNSYPGRFVVVANISDLKNRRAIEIVLRTEDHSRFEALKVVQCLRDPKMLLRSEPSRRLAPIYLVVTSAKFKSPEQPKAKKSAPYQSRHRKSTSRRLKPAVHHSQPKRALKEHTRSSKRRHRASVAGLTQLRQEEADIYEARQRSQWRRIFDLFDDDGEGSIDRNEMRDLMRKFSPEATIDEIEAVCDALDSDGGGDIRAEEFFDFTQAHFSHGFC